MWNQFDLQCPADDICEYPKQDKLITEDFSNLVTILTTGAEILTADHPIWTEIKVFHNIQEKYKRILHCDKCLQLLQRVGTCLRKVVLLNLSKNYLDLAERFLVGLQDTASVPFLPSRQQLEFVLIRTQAAAKLIFEALHYSRQTFCYLLQRLRIGHIILTLIMAASVTARVHIMFKGLLMQLFDLYRKLHPWCEKLKRGDWKWPEILELPDDLEAWLKPEESAALKPISMPKEKVDFLTTFFNKIKSKENHSSTVDLENEKPDEDCIIIEDGNSSQAEAFDIGEIITREDVRPIELNEAQDILLCKICRAAGFKKLKRLWDNIDVESQNSLPKKLTAKRTQYIENLLSQLHQNVYETKKLPLSNKKRWIKIISLVQLAGFKFAKRLGLVQNEEQYLTFHVEKLKWNSPLKLAKPVKSFSELQRHVVSEIKAAKTLSKLQSPPVDNSKSTKTLSKLQSPPVGNSESTKTLSKLQRMAIKKCKAIKTVNKLEELYEEIYQELKQMNQLKKCRKLKKIYESRLSCIEHLKQNDEESAKKLISCTSKVLLMIFRNS